MDVRLVEGDQAGNSGRVVPKTDLATHVLEIRCFMVYRPSSVANGEAGNPPPLTRVATGLAAHP